MAHKTLTVSNYNSDTTASQDFFIHPILTRGFTLSQSCEQQIKRRHYVPRNTLGVFHESSLLLLPAAVTGKVVPHKGMKISIVSLSMAYVLTELKTLNFIQVSIGIIFILIEKFS